MPNTPCGNSSSSPAIAFSRPWTRAMPSPIETMRADFGDVDVDGVAADLLADDLGDLFGFDVHLTDAALLKGRRPCFCLISLQLRA